MSLGFFCTAMTCFLHFFLGALGRQEETSQKAAADAQQETTMVRGADRSQLYPERDFSFSVNIFL